MTKAKVKEANEMLDKKIIDDIWDGAYKSGQEAAWKAAAQIAKMSSAELSKHFGEVYPEAVFEKVPVDEAISKLNKE